MATITRCVNRIIEASGSTRYAARVLAAARAGYPITGDGFAGIKNDSIGDSLSIEEAYNIIASACRNGIRPGDDSMRVAHQYALNNQRYNVIDAAYQAESLKIVEENIYTINNNGIYGSNTERYSDQPYKFQPGFNHVLIQAYQRSFRLQDSLPVIEIEKAEESWTTRVKNTLVAGVSSQKFWAFLVAGASAMSSYAFAYQYYKEHGVGTHNESVLRHLCAHIGGFLSYLVYGTLLYNYDLKRIRSMVMQYKVSDVKNALLRSLKTLFTIETNTVFQRQYNRALVGLFMVVNLFTTFNSPYLSGAHIKIPVIREISMMGSFFSALLGNNVIFENAYAKPLNNFYHNRIMPWYLERQGDLRAASRIRKAHKRREHLRAILATAKQRIDESESDQLAVLLRLGKQHLREDLSRQNITPFLLALGDKYSSLDPKNQCHISKQEVVEQSNSSYMLEIVGHSTVLFVATYALSTCFAQGRDAVAATFKWLYENINAQLLFILGCCAGVSSVAINMLIGYYSVMFVYNILYYYHLSDGEPRSWLASAANLSGLLLIAVANTIPAYQVSVDHPELPGASYVLAIVGFCMSIFSINGYFQDRMYEKFDLVDNIDAVCDDQDVNFVKLRRVLNHEIDQADAMLEATDDDMIEFYYNELGTEQNLDAPVTLSLA